MTVLFGVDQVVELRFPGRGKGWGGGWFSDHKLLAEEARKASREGAKAVYLTLNPVNPALLARCANRVQAHTEVATSDNDILCRRWLPVDVDPVRPAGVSATAEEHDRAHAAAIALRSWLAAQGWPQPIYADSGNGAHLLYRVDLPNDEPARRTVQRCLEALSARWSDAQINVDVKNFNAARIWKCYGTMARKGDDTPDRPHRIAKILDSPEVQEVAPELLMALADSLPKPPAQGQRRSEFDLAAWIAKHGLRVVADSAWQASGYRWVLDRCPFNADHTDRAAVLLRHPSGAVSFSCLHNSCAGNDWTALRNLLEPGRQHTELQPLGSPPPRRNGAPPEEPARVTRGDLKTADELASAYTAYIQALATKKIQLGWTEIDRQIRGIGPGEVMTVIAKSRAGKSAFLQNILRAIALRNTVGSLWCSMEQPASQVFERYAAMAMDERGEDIEQAWSTDPVAVISVTTQVRSELGEHALTCDIPGLTLEEIELATTMARDKTTLPLGLLALDYLGLIDGSNLDRSLYGQTSRVVRELKTLAKRQEIAVILLCQVSRQPGDDGSKPLTINSARESGAIEEAADFLLGLYRPNIGKDDDDTIVVQVLKNRKGADGNAFSFSFDRRTLVIGKEALAAPSVVASEPDELRMGWSNR